MTQTILQKAAITRSARRTGDTLKFASGRTLTFDCTIDVACDDTAVVTQNPVEAPEGGKPALAATDHIIRQPIQLSVQAILNDFPNVGTAERDRSVRAYELLRAIKDAGELVRFSTSRRTYPTMLIQQLSDRSRAAGQNAILVDMQLLEVRLAQRDYTQVPDELLREPQRSRADSDEGAAGAVEASDEESAAADEELREVAKDEANQGSILYDLGSGLGDLFSTDGGEPAITGGGTD